MDSQKIGKFILALRKEKKLTQQELANRLNVTDRAVSHWENGRSIPDISLFKPLCELFEISVSELISGERLDQESLFQESEKTIINTLEINKKRRKKSLRIISLLIISVLALFIAIIIGVKEKYHKIDLYNFMVQQYDSERQLSLKKIITIGNRSVYYYGINSSFFCEKSEKCYQLGDALSHNQIKLSDFKSFLDKQVEYDNYSKDIYYDGGTSVYSKGDFQIIFCNTLEGNRDVYIGNSSMINNLNGEYCGHDKNENKSYIKTYKVLKSSIYSEDSEFNVIVLEDIKGNTGEAIINNSYLLVPGRVYHFSLLTFDIFEETINNIFKHSTLLYIDELVDFDESDWINEAVIVNKDTSINSNLNELNYVKMAVIDDTVTSTSIRIKITDLSGKRYVYGNDYRLDIKNGDKWQEVTRKKTGISNSKAYYPDKNGELDFYIDWRYVYGNLEPGKYRLVKSALDTHDKKCDPTCKHYYIAVEFEIE